MDLSRIERFLTTSLVDSNRVEQFADQCLLAPLHYLLHAAYGSHYPRKYQVVSSIVTPIQRSSAEDSRSVRIAKIFAACIAALLLTLPGIIIKRLAQLDSSSFKKHAVLEKYLTTPPSASRTFFQTSNGPFFKHLIPFLTALDVSALCQTHTNGRFHADIETVSMETERKKLRHIKAPHREFRTFFDQHEVALWRTVAHRFPDYRHFKESNAPFYHDPLNFVMFKYSEIQGIRKHFPEAPQLLDFFGGGEKVLCLRGGLSDSNSCSRKDPVFRTTGVWPNFGIGIRVIRELKNEVMMPQVLMGVFEDGDPETWRPQEEELVILFQAHKLLGHNNEIKLFVEANLWPAKYSFYAERFTLWTNSKGSQWLRDLLDGKTCGLFPGIPYETLDGEKPIVTYRLRPVNYQPPQPAAAQAQG